MRGGAEAQWLGAGDGYRQIPQQPPAAAPNLANELGGFGVAEASQTHKRPAIVIERAEELLRENRRVMPELAASRLAVSPAAQ